MIGNAGEPIRRPSHFTFAKARALLLAADDADRHDRRVGLEGEAQEAEAEALELVALA